MLELWDIKNIIARWEKLDSYKDIAKDYNLTSERIRQLVKENVSKKKYKVVKRIKSANLKHNRVIKSIIMVEFAILSIILFPCFTTYAEVEPEVNHLPVNEDKEFYYKEVELSAYNAEVAQCDSDPFTMANMNRVYEGAIACSRDLSLGTVVEILNKRYVCEDRMNIRYKNNIDIFMWDKQEAIKFGRKIAMVKIFK